MLVPCVSCANSTSREEMVVRYSNTVASPAELVPHYHCLDLVVLVSMRILAAILPSDTKYLSETTLVNFLQGLQIISICNPRPLPVEYTGNTNDFVDHHFILFPGYGYRRISCAVS